MAVVNIRGLIELVWLSCKLMLLSRSLTDDCGFAPNSRSWGGRRRIRSFGCKSGTIGEVTVDISMDGSDPATWDPALDGVLAAPENHRVLYEDDVIRVISVSGPVALGAN